jgi:hypothetical protein
MQFIFYFFLSHYNYFLVVILCCGRNNLSLLLLLQAKGKGLPTKISILLLNLLPFDPNVMSLPRGFIVLDECLWWVLIIHFDLMLSNVFMMLIDLWCFFDICFQTIRWFWSVLWFYVVARFDVLLHVLDEVVANYFLIN